MDPSGFTTSTESITNGLEQYSENIVTIVSSDILALVRSVAVISMNTFLVFKVILEWSPLMIGGIERTVLLLSYMIG